MNLLYYKRLSTYKNLEIQLSHFGNWLSFEVSFNAKLKGDHKGARFCVGIFGLYFSIEFYDSRHEDI